MNWTTKDIPSQAGRTVLVTGANSGLGFHSSMALAGAGAQVLMACRTASKAQAAAEKIRARHPQAQLVVLSLDLSSLDSVRACAAQVARDHTSLDLLLNNAGVMAVPLGRTAEGFETQIGTNHFGHFALTGLLVPLLQAAPQARIVNVASMAHNWTPGLDFDDLDWQSRKYKRWQAYGDSKISNLYFTYELARRLHGSTVTVAAAHPGFSDTHLQYVAAEQKNNPVEKAVMWLGNTLFAQSAEMGALPSLFAATNPDVHAGDYIGPSGFQQTRGYPRKVNSSRLSRDKAVAARLWEVSTQRTGVQYAV